MMIGSEWLLAAKFATTMIVGFLCGYGLHRAHMPGGMLVGAILGAGIVNLGFHFSYVPHEAKFLAQVIAGAFVGCSVDKASLKRLPALCRPLLIIMGALAAAALLSGWLLYRLLDWDFVTAFLCCVPGGMTEVPLIALDIGADVKRVTFLQFGRLFYGVLVVPAIISAAEKRRSAAVAQTTIKPEAPPQENMGVSTAILLTASLAGGVVGKMSGIPAGTISGALVFGAMVRLLMNRGRIPPFVKRMAQLFSGAYVGSSLTQVSMENLVELTVPLAVLLIAYSINTVATGRMLMRVCSYERKMAYMAATPAGASDMALIVSELGITNSDIVLLQIFRMVLVISLFPPAIQWLSQIL